MSVKYVPVTWNRNKLIYDLVLIVAVVVYICVYLLLAPQFQSVSLPIDRATLRMQAFGTCAFFMLTFILCIGPLARLDTRFLPLLYNRRHFGVLTCAVAFVHASFVLGWYQAFSPTDRYIALLTSNTSYGQILGFPFEMLGIAALVILLILAVTSHDFWMSFLTPPVWKAMHMSIYAAYALVVMHIALGYLQSADNPLFAATVALSVMAVCALHFWASRAPETRPEEQAKIDGKTWILAGSVHDIAEKRGITLDIPGGERIAVFKYDGKVSALTNACAHQNGPLGEGKIIGGCVTCPWHGFQFNPADGCAPAPFTDKVSTYNVKVMGAQIFVDPTPNPPGTRVEPAIIPGGAPSDPSGLSPEPQPQAS